MRQQNNPTSYDESLEQALRAIMGVTRIPVPRYALQEYGMSCVPAIEEMWLPFIRFRAFFSLELAPRHITSPALGRRAWRDYTLPQHFDRRQVEQMIGCSDIRSHIIESYDVTNTLVHQCMMDDQFTPVDVGVTVAVLAHLESKIEVPEIVVPSAVACLGIAIAKTIAQQLFHQDLTE